MAAAASGALPRTTTTAAGVAMPRMLYGTAWKAGRTPELVELALRCGFAGIDTAAQPKHYYEPGVGGALARVGVLQQLQQQPPSTAAAAAAAAAGPVFLQTKFTPLAGQDRAQPLPYDASAPLREQVVQSFATSCRNLGGVARVDSLVLHSPLPTHAELMEVWRAMEGLVDAGRVSQLGISNCYDAGVLRRLLRDAAVKPAVLQNRFHAKTGYDRELRAEFCVAPPSAAAGAGAGGAGEEGGHKLVFQAFWSLTANPGALKSRAVRAAAAARGVAPEQAWYRFLLQLGLVVLNGTTSERHMRDDLRVLDWGAAAAPGAPAALSAEEMAAIGAVIGERVAA